MRLPRGDEAIVDPRKLIDYVLSPAHSRGRHKARVFAAALGLTFDDAHVLEAALRVAAATLEATATRADEHGQRYQIEFMFHFRERSAMIASAWLLPTEPAPPRLLTLYLKP